MAETAKSRARETYHHGDLRAKLIDATRGLVEEKGADHFSVTDAARAAGVSSAAPYKHFRDRDELLRAVALEGMLRQKDQMIAELRGIAPGTLDRIVALGRVYVRFATSEPGVFRLMFGLSKDHDEHEELVQMGDGTFDVVIREVAACRGSTEPNEDDARRAFLLWSFVHGISFLQIDGKLKKAKIPVDLEDTLIEIARRVVEDAMPAP